ncbi:hypothetical protein HGQ17_02545 [Nesterenkonia sp. MY13]|uniref:ATP-dependent Clp protease proteolytic subunit n=1 Tax=Nesterenkonia sedimenti TaxID=1463632 RepID=A0A7X8TID7_9MICC|nr:ATP-dependent Clp protease proteolytic subunit [Nesterenkonia sedimenti]NLS08897.1 hypothetical protein [Nesterenkonia sedimenti]
MSTYTIPNVITRDWRGERVMDVYSHLLAESVDSPVNLYINCEGGDPSATMAIYDTMQYIKAPVATTCVAILRNRRSLAPRTSRQSGWSAEESWRCSLRWASSSMPLTLPMSV